MDTLLNNQDWAVDPCGNPVAVSGWEEEQQRCMIRLQVPKGAFPYQPELGSGLHALAAQAAVGIPGVHAQAQAAQMTRADCAARAMELAQEALLPMPYIRVCSASCRYDADGRFTGFSILLAGAEWEKEVLIQTDE